MRVLGIAALALTGCTQPAPVADTGSATPAASPTPVEAVADTPASDPLQACDGGKAQALLGRTVDGALKAEAMRLVGARGVRVIAPGMMVTMDYRTDRLNIDTDAANKATRFHCG